jgi:hypothetical protein
VWVHGECYRLTKGPWRREVLKVVDAGAFAMFFNSEQGPQVGSYRQGAQSCL